MQQVVFDEPYKFVPPVYTLWWPRVLRYYLPRYVRKAHGVHSLEYRNVERFRELRKAGHAIVLAPNHCRMADPLVLGMLALQADCYLFAMASWHLFKQSRFQTFMIRRMGAFSLFREGNDRQSIDTAINILVDRTRPLIMFPEGALTRHNDLIEEMMEGPSFIARQAAKRMKKEGQSAEVVILPVAIRYAFQGDLEASLGPVLDEFEQRFAWQPQRHQSLVERIDRIGQALLALKEVEYFGSPRNGNPYERAERLVDELLAQLEGRWQVKDTSGSVIARVKRLRTAILNDLTSRALSTAERDERWRDLAACYYVQQLSHYPRDYILREKNLPERVVETVERFEEDFTDRMRIHRPFHCVIQVGEPIPVGTQRIRDPIEDPIMAEVRRQLQSMMNALAAERTAV
jgi:1-acyl-sn-glycerol-3-phosphate acyltransferase